LGAFVLVLDRPYDGAAREGIYTGLQQQERAIAQRRLPGPDDAQDRAGPADSPHEEEDESSVDIEQRLRDNLAEAETTSVENPEFRQLLKRAVSDLSVLRAT